MFTTDNIYLDISLKDIESKISDIDIFKKYCTGFQEINKDFKSEFYTDNNPSCRIYQKNNNRLAYKDFGGSGEHLNPYEYVMKKHTCTFKEALKIIANDFNLLKVGPVTKPSFILGEFNIEVKKVEKSTISIVSRNWNLTDYKYWYNNYNITFDWLDSYEVIPCEYVYLHKGEKTIVFQNTKENPIYAYRFTIDGKYVYKVYFPLHPDKKRKWLFSGTSDCIEGFDQLPYHDDLLIITKSLKDVICCRLCGYSAISLQGESNKLSKELVEKLKKRFKKFVIFYDNDNQGIISANKITENYGFKSIIIDPNDKSKDLSDYIKNNGLNQAKTMLNKLLNEVL